jgi:hypothetical protein
VGFCNNMARQNKVQLQPAPITGNPWVNRTSRVFKNTPNDGQAPSAQQAAVNVEGWLRAVNGLLLVTVTFAES